MFKILPKLKPLSINFLKKNNIWTSSFKNFKPFNLTKSNFTSEHSSQELTNKNHDQKDVSKYSKRGKFRVPYSISNNDVLHNFKVNKIEEFPDYEMTGYSLTHLKTGASYYHLDSPDISNAFVVHFKTPAFDNTGIFHILEHLTLCGSKKYPIRDPFMNMTKRSLNSYMNAWTGPDFTMYPFATHNEKDFKNLLEVYMDATFFPRLDYYDFLQEGWRYEFFEQTNDKSDLLYKGIVFNEMKGDMARQDTNFIHKLQSNIFNNNTYKFNSGGDPQFIPMLTHSDIINAHKKYYHPSNSKFLTYGDLNFIEHLEYINDVLSQVPEIPHKKIEVPLAIRFDNPKEVIDSYQPEVNLGDVSTAKLGISFLCNDITTDPYTTFKLSFLSQLLMEGPGSTMFKLLIESGLAPGYCPGYGFDTTIRECLMTIGVQNIENDYKKFNEISKTIFSGLKEVAEKGINKNLIEEVLHLIEFDSKKPRNDFAVNMFNQASGFLTHSNNPFSLLYVNEFSKRIRNELTKEKVFEDLVKQYILNNNHQLKLILKPDYDIIHKQNTDEFQRLKNVKDSLTDEDKIRIIKDSVELNKHQNQLQDPNILPCISIEDIPTETEKVEYKTYKLAHGIQLYHFDQPTNGTSFIRIKGNVAKIPKEIKNYLDLYNEILPKLGTQSTEYEEFQNKFLTFSTGLNISIDTYNDISDQSKSYENLVYEFSFLDRNMNKAFDLLDELLSHANFFDFNNLSQLIKMESVKIANEITSSAIDYAISIAQSGLKRNLREHDRFKYDMFLCNYGAEILKTSDPKIILNSIGEKMNLLHFCILKQENLSISYHGNKKNLDSIIAKLSLLLNSIKNENSIFSEELDEVEQEEFKEIYHKKLVQTPSQVSDCVEAFKIPLYSHEDFPKCVIMAHVLGLNDLHKEIREKGGAYSAGASPSDNGTCVLYSFRDPDPNRSYIAFEKGIVNISKGNFKENDIKEAKIYAFSQVDKIINPSNKGLVYFLRSKTEEEINTFRTRLMNVTREDIMEVANKYFVKQLEDGTTSRVIFGSQTLNTNEFEDNGWEISSALEFLSEKYFKDEEDGSNSFNINN